MPDTNETSPKKGSSPACSSAAGGAGVTPGVTAARMVVTDLDGTLLNRDQKVSPIDLATLVSLPEGGVLRVIATGRSLYSARKVLPESFPVDYLVFSSGAGIMDWRSGVLVKKEDMAQDKASEAVEKLKSRRFDFMVHRPVPQNHYFVYFETGRENADFQRRLAIYREFSSRLEYSAPFREEACQIVVVEPPGDGPANGGSVEPPGNSPAPAGPAKPPGAARLRDALALELPSLRVIRTTSPIDGESTWIEIFPPSVSKARAAEWIAAREGIEFSRILALGNDYNDLDLLDWAPAGYLVANAPDDLKTRFPTVGSHEENGFTEAIGRWLSGVHNKRLG
jgi:hydroxymethylpyrimidine pyrophosphatase-like HAD family hydrolase